MPSPRDERIQVRSKSSGLTQFAPKSWLKVYPDLVPVAGVKTSGETKGAVGRKPSAPKSAPKPVPAKATIEGGPENGSNTLEGSPEAGPDSEGISSNS